MSFRRFIWAFGAVAGLAATAMAQTSTTSTTVTRQFSFPPVGLASSETAQVNVVNLAAASATGTAASCAGTVSFFNASGVIIGSASSFTVGSNQIFSASLPFAKVGASGGRSEIRGVVSLTQTTGSGVPCTLSSSLETYDTATSVTHVFLADGAEGAYAAGPGPVR